jgi:ferredoxin-NADP reductase
MKDHTVKVIETITRTPTAISVRMEKPAGFDYEPGQWASFTIDCSGEKVAKPLSFSSSPTEPFLEFTKRITGSTFCQGITDLAPGSNVTLHGPLGHMVYREGTKSPVFISGGIGITPVRSMLKYIQDKDLAGPKKLLYANHSLKEAAFRDEFEMMASDNGLSITYVYEEPPPGWNGATGFITLELLKELFPDPSGRSWYLCGPPAMVNCLTADLEKLGVKKESLLFERLEGYEGFV